MAKLTLVPTPIGNLKDITIRALEVLQEADLILAEDTRTSRVLLNHHQISTRLESYHMHNEHKVLARYIEQLESGVHIALISDAGTPAISDPGFLLVREAIKNNIDVETLPGPTAFVPALVNSGLPCDKFVFEGFLPVKKGRQTRLTFLQEENRTMVFYESPHKLVKTLGDFVQYFGPDRPASFSRELSKKFEETYRGTVSELLMYAESKTLKGEFVLVVGGKENSK
jgi:16S rRNA (cytidine1402-2'-O)-methyltransferase